MKYNLLHLNTFFKHCLQQLLLSRKTINPTKVQNLVCFTDNESIDNNIKHSIESSRVPIIFKNMLDDWEPFKWDLQKWNSLFEKQLLDCRKGRITCTKVC